MELKLKMKSKMKLEEVEFEVEDGVEVDQILTELDQTKLNWALTQLKLKLVVYYFRPYLGQKFLSSAPKKTLILTLANPPPSSSISLLPGSLNNLEKSWSLTFK